MKIKDTLKIEMENLISDLVGKIDVEPDVKTLSVNEVFDVAIKQKVFDPLTYTYSEDSELLFNMLVYSLGLSSLWNTFKQENPNADYLAVNQVIIQYMRNMWGLEEVPTLHAGDLTQD